MSNFAHFMTNGAAALPTMRSVVLTRADVPVVRRSGNLDAWIESHAKIKPISAGSKSSASYLKENRDIRGRR